MYNKQYRGDLLEMSTADNVFRFATSDSLLMMGGQLLFIIVCIFMAFYGTHPTEFPADQMRNTIRRLGLNAKTDAVPKTIILAQK